MTKGSPTSTRCSSCRMHILTRVSLGLTQHLLPVLREESGVALFEYTPLLSIHPPHSDIPPSGTAANVQSISRVGSFGVVLALHPAARARPPRPPQKRVMLRPKIQFRNQ